MSFNAPFTVFFVFLSKNLLTLIDFISTQSDGNS